MTMTRIVSLILALFCIAAQPLRAEEADARKPVTILISIDGFRADYLDRGLTPHIARLAAEGAHGRLRPSFPTKTFPNHYAIVTSKRHDSHGIVGNRLEERTVGKECVSTGSSRWSPDP